MIQASPERAVGVRLSPGAPSGVSLAGVMSRFGVVSGRVGRIRRLEVAGERRLRAGVLGAVGPGSAGLDARPLGAGQQVAGVSVLSFWRAASRSLAQGRVFWRCSFARRPDNASRAAASKRR